MSDNHISEGVEFKMDETHKVYKKVFEPIAKVFCAVMIMALIVLMFLLGYWLAENKNKSLIVINKKLDTIQADIDNNITEINSRSYSMA